MATRPTPEEQRKLRAAQRRLARERRSPGGFQRSNIGRAHARALERIRAPVASTREMNVIAQEGQHVTLSEVSGLTKSERHAVWRHWAIIEAYLNHGGVYQPENPYSKSYYSRKRLENMIRNYEGKRTGGINPVEFASDPDDIVQLAQAEDISFENMYPHISAAAA